MEHKRITNRFTKALMDKPELETLDYEPEQPLKQSLKELDREYGKLEESKIPIEDINLEQSLKQPSPLETVDSFASSGTEQLPGRDHDKACECGKCPEQPIDAQKLTKEIIETEAELRAMGNKPKSETEQPNTELLIIKTIQGLISAANRELNALNKLVPAEATELKVLIGQVLEDINLTERTTLFELQKAFE